MQVIRKTKSHFPRHGIPEQLITDNGPQFVSQDFQVFTKEWDVEHLTSSPYHSQANGKAESAVKEAKKILRKSKKTNSDEFLALLDHRNTPSASMKTSPTQRLLNRRARTLLPTTASFLQPRTINSESTRVKLAERKQQQAKYYNRGAVELDPLEVEAMVRKNPLRLGRKEWEKGVVPNRLDQRSYEVETSRGILRRNRVHLRRTKEVSPETRTDALESSPRPSDTGDHRDTNDLRDQRIPTKESSNGTTRSEVTLSPSSRENAPVVRASGRARRPPSYLKDFVLT